MFEESRADDAIVIVGGDPAHEPASFSRFLLPFAYQPRPASILPEERFRPGPEDDPDLFRRRYFNVETADVLYQRARWLTLHRGDQPAPPRWFSIHRPPHGASAGRSIGVELAAPRMVLFEATARTDTPQPDVLRTGFLVLELSFRSAGVSLGDLLFVNELFRMWLEPFAKHNTERRFAESLLEAPRRLEDWAPREGPTGPGALAGTTEGLYFERWASLLSVPCEIDGQAWQLVSAEAQEQARTWVKNSQGPPGWIVSTDARAYTWTCAVVDRGAAALVPEAAPAEGGSAAESGGWLRLLNVDLPDAFPPSAFEREWLRDRTYLRWAHFGSLYGFTVHSGAAVLPPSRDLELWRHFREPYFDQTLLLLYARTGLFRFSRWLAEVSGEARGREPDDREPLLEDLTQVRQSLTLFSNLYLYPLLSNHQQSLEMYTVARRVMDIEELTSELRQQIEGSHDLVEMQADREEALAARRLNVVAALGLILAVATGLLGINVVIGSLGDGRFPKGPEWVTLLGAGWLAMSVMVLGYRQWRRIERWLFGRTKLAASKETR